MELTAYGNVLSSLALLHGLAAEELSGEKLDFRDPDYELIVGLRAVKPADRRGEALRLAAKLETDQRASRQT